METPIAKQIVKKRANGRKIHKNYTLAAKDPKQRGLKGSLGVYSLVAYSLGVYTSGVYRATDSRSHATDFGSGEPHTRSERSDIEDPST